MSNFLAIDTSSRYLTVLAVKGEKKVLRHRDDCAMRHSVILMDEIHAALKEAGLSPSECGFFAAVTGPGSFTGIRIGIAAAKGFALAADKPLVSVTSFELIAYNVTCDRFYAVIDAAHGCYYVCGFGADKQIILSPCYLSGEQAENLGAPLYGFEDIPLKNYTKTDISDSLFKAATANARVASGKMTALYVRKSQAEEARKC